MIASGSPPRTAISSSLTALMTCWPGVRLLESASPWQRARTPSRKARTTDELDVGVEQGRRGSRRAPRRGRFSRDATPRLAARRRSGRAARRVRQTCWLEATGRQGPRRRGARSHASEVERRHGAQSPSRASTNASGSKATRSSARSPTPTSRTGRPSSRCDGEHDPATGGPVELGEHDARSRPTAWANSRAWAIRSARSWRRGPGGPRSPARGPGPPRVAPSSAPRSGWPCCAAAPPCPRARDRSPAKPRGGGRRGRPSRDPRPRRRARGRTRPAWPTSRAGRRPRRGTCRPRRAAPRARRQPRAAASLPMVVVLPTPFTPTNSQTATLPSSVLVESGAGAGPSRARAARSGAHR